MVLLMSVNPDFGGQKFIPATLDKLRKARRMIDESGYDVRLEIDGGVKVGNIREIAEAGADIFVAGSAIFDSGDYRATSPRCRPSWAGWVRDDHMAKQHRQQIESAPIKLDWTRLHYHNA